MRIHINRRNYQKTYIKEPSLRKQIVDDIMSVSDIYRHGDQFKSHESIVSYKIFNII